MSHNTQYKQWRPASGVEILSTRMQEYTQKHKIHVPPQEIVWMKLWAQVACGKLGKMAVASVSCSELLKTAKILAYAKRTTKQRRAARK